MRTLTFAAALSTIIFAVVVTLAFVYGGANAGIGPPDLVVNNTADPGDGTCDVAECTLREAMDDANLAPGTTIVFDIPGCPPACTIAVSAVDGDLPTVTAAGTMIDGATEPDYTNVPIIIVDGSALSSGEPGIYIQANDATVRGLIIQNFPGMGVNSTDGSGSLSGTTIEGNIVRDNGTYGIGLNGGDHTVTGNIIEGNGDEGIGAAFGGSGTGLMVDGNQVIDNGGTGIRSSIINTTLTNNVVSGSGFRGIDAGDGEIVATGNVVTDSGQVGLFVSGDSSLVTGNTATGNGETGIVVGGGPGTVVDNISINNGFAFQTLGIGPAGVDPGDGFEIGGSANEAKVLTGNTASGNARHGIAVFSTGNVIGGTGTEDANVSTGNGGAGVWVQDLEVGNSILSNSIYDNDGLGIDLEPDGVTVNDLLDVDSGANNLQNFPLLATAEPGSVTVSGDLESSPLTEFRLEFFHNDACDVSGFGEGKTLIGAFNVTTDVSGNAPIDALFDAAPSVGFVTATATHQVTGDTSEFSNCIEIQSPATPTPTPSPEPTPSGGPTPTVAPTPTPSGTSTPTATALPSGTPSPTASPLGELWGDVDCNEAVNPVDSLKILRYDAGLSVAQEPDCPPVGEPVDVGGDEEQWGDVDCSEAVNPVDSLKILRYDAGLSVAQEPDCPEVGIEV